MKKLLFLLLMNPYILLAQQKSVTNNYFREIARVYFNDPVNPIAIFSKFLYHKTDKDTAYQIRFRVWEDGHYDKHWGAITFFGKNKTKNFLNLLKHMQVKRDLIEMHVIKQHSYVTLTIFWQDKELIVQTTQFRRVFWSMNCSKSTIDKLNVF